MKTRTLSIQFHSPAFLGDAAQSGRWRSPPFKAQLRQWWRVAYAADRRFLMKVTEMREVEGRLFGNAWLKDNFSKSQVRIRLSDWRPGRLTRWESSTAVQHGEVGRVGSDLYLGYGPLLTQARQVGLKHNAAIQSGEIVDLSIAYPEADAPLIDHALQLMHAFGTVGGRSRNGWGSYALESLQDSAQVEAMRPWKDCLREDWPHAIGLGDDEVPLIWQTKPHRDWKALMATLAEIKIAMRTQFKFPQARPDGAIHDRHWLSYPVTNHPVQTWGANARLPNTLRFKVRPEANGQVVGVVFHVPHLPPPAFKPDLNTLQRIWHRVHAQLDQDQRLHRIPA